jgi:hypothetical protein
MKTPQSRTRDVIRQACSDRGLPLVHSDESRDQFDRDGALLTVDYKANGDIRKAWVNERMGERVINGTSKQRKVLSYIRSGFIV